MKEGFPLGDNIAATITRRVGASEKLSVRGHFQAECRDRYGNLKWTDGFDNLIVNEGLDDLLSKYLKGSSYTANWYVGLVDAANFSSFSAGDTASGIGTSSPSNGWQEFDEYDESNRQDWTGGTVSSQSVDNSGSKATFTISASGTVKGAFVISDNTIGGTSGVLLSEGAFSSDRNVEDDDTLNVTVTYTSSDQ